MYTIEALGNVYCVNLDNETVMVYNTAAECYEFIKAQIGI